MILLNRDENWGNRHLMKKMKKGKQFNLFMPISITNILNISTLLSTSQIIYYEQTKIFPLVQTAIQNERPFSNN